MDEHAHLLPEVRAKTILAGCHRAQVSPSGDTGSAGAAGQPVALLTLAGDLYLAVPRTAEAPVGRIRLTGRSQIGGLGLVRLTGSCDRRTALTETTSLVSVAASRRLPTGEGPDGADWSDLTGLDVVRVKVEAVRVLVPVAGRNRARAIPVAVSAFRSAMPDSWVLHGRQAVARVEASHQDELRVLARECLTGTAVEAVVIRRVSSAQLELACIGFEGVSELRIPLDRPVHQPGQLREWLQHAVRRRRGAA